VHVFSLKLERHRQFQLAKPKLLRLNVLALLVLATSPGVDESDTKTQKQRDRRRELRRQIAKEERTYDPDDHDRLQPRPFPMKREQRYDKQGLPF